MKIPFWGRGRREEELDEEVRSHLEMAARDQQREGKSPEEATLEARRAFGNLGQVKETTREMWIGSPVDRAAAMVDTFVADLRYGLRSLGRTPGWTAVVLLTIALGVGATTTMFSVAYTLLVRPLPYPGASRVFIARRVADAPRLSLPVPFGILPVWQKDARTIEAATAFIPSDPVQMGNGSDAVTAHAARVDSTFLAFAGVHPVVGRNFDSNEMTPGGPGAALISEQFWRRQYGRSPNVVGRVVQIDSQSFTIVGVVPASLVVPDFNLPHPDVLLPARMTRAGSVFVRLKPGISPQAATAELEGLFKNANLFDPAARMLPPMTTSLSRLQDGLKVRPAMLMLTGAVGLLLVVACINVASLLLARGAARQREFAVRHALGARRARLVQQLTTEALALAVLGGVLAVGVGWLGVRLLAALRPAQLADLAFVSESRGVVAIAATLAIVAGIAIGFLAAFRIAHNKLGAALRVGTSSSGVGGRRLRSSLVVGEIAVSTVLLVGGLLLIRATVGLQRTPLGFDERGLYAATFVLPEAPPGVRAGFAADVRERAEEVFGAGQVTLGAPPRRYRRVFGGAIETPEQPEGAGLGEPVAHRVVAPDYFGVLGMPLVSGRSFAEGSATRNEAIVSQSLARRLWPNESAIGRRFRIAARRPDAPVQPWHTVVAVVPEMVLDLVQGGEHLGMYVPFDMAQPDRDLTLLVRAEGDGGGEQLKQFAASVEPTGSETTIENLRAAIDESMAEPRFLTRILTVLAMFGVLLAAIGLFGVVAYNVGQRTREIAVRMTFGATRREIAQLVVGNGIRLALLGMGLGLLGAVGATRLIQSQLYGVSRLDPLAFGLAAVVLFAAAVVACLVPTLRATSVEPVIALQSE